MLAVDGGAIPHTIFFFRLRVSLFALVDRSDLCRSLRLSELQISSLLGRLPRITIFPYTRLTPIQAQLAHPHLLRHYAAERLFDWVAGEVCV